jgi:hypothetical protein
MRNSSIHEQPPSGNSFPTALGPHGNRIFGRDRLSWRGNVLQLGRQKLAEVVPAEWPGMWRVTTCDGQLTDMVNLARARDAARALGVGILNQKQTQETPSEAPCVRQNIEGVLGQPPLDIVAREDGR